MQAVITTEQARKITGGRTPLVPVEYETACRALAECSTLDEAKYWDSKADALAAWARIYKNDQAGTEARRLKLHAFRRMGQIAEELRPTQYGGARPELRGAVAGQRGSGAKPGARSLLMESGLTGSAASNALLLQRQPQREFDKIVTRSNPPSPEKFRQEKKPGGEAWKIVSACGVSLVAFRAFARRYGAGDLAKGLSADEAEKARVIATELQEWLDEFEQHLTK